MAEWGEGGVFEGEGGSSYCHYTTHTIYTTNIPNTDIIAHSINTSNTDSTANISSRTPRR